MAAESPDRDALLTPQRNFTFAGLRAEVRRAAAAMIDHGVAPGDHVAIWLPNTWHWVVTCLAVHYAGAVIVPLNIRFTAREAGEILARVNAPLLVAAAEFAGSDRVAELDRTGLPALRHIVRIGADADRDGLPDGWDDFVATPHAGLDQVCARAAAVRSDDVSDIFFTSGTTGRSKGVLCSHRQSLAATAAVWDASGGLGRADRYLCVNPFFHTFGYRFGIVACLQAGAALVPQAVFDPEQVLATIAGRRITVFPGPPVVFQLLLEHPERPHHDLTSWRLAVTGSTTLPAALIERMHRELDVDVVTGYGLTECSGYGTTCRPGDDAVTVATTCGRPIPGLQLRIDCPDAAGVGEVLLRGPYVMSGYLDDPQATAEVVDGDGWLHTGDLGTIDGSGNLRITGRIKDMYICGGFNVYPAEVEQELSRLDGVSEVAVVGVPDPRLGEVGRAFIVVAPESRLDESAVIAYGRKCMADFKVPRSVIFVSELPRNASCKVLKADLRSHPVSAAWADRHAAGAMPLGLGGPPLGMVENWIADAWQSLLRVDRPGRLDRFTDLGGNSLDAVEFSRMLNFQYGVTISLDSLAARQTIAELVGDLEPGVTDVRESVVKLRFDGNGPVYLMVPGLGAHAWIFSRLAAALTGPCDVYALSLMDIGVRRVEGIRSAIRSAALAALQVEAHKGRPIVLVGFSFGALIAADLARWLVAGSVPVQRLCLLDPKPLESHSSFWERSKRAVAANDLVEWFRTRVQPGWRTEHLVVLSPAAQELQHGIVAMSRKIVKCYLDGSVRLPSMPVACIRTPETVAASPVSSTLFGIPLESVDLTTAQFGHTELMTSVRGVSFVATWLQRSMDGVETPS